MTNTRPELRPLGVGEIVDAAIRLYSTNFATLIKISAAVLVPIGVLQLVFSFTVDPIEIAASSALDPNAAVFDGLWPFYLVVLLTSFIGTVLVQAASIIALAQVYQGLTPDWAQSIRAGMRRGFALLVATTLLGIGSTLGLILLVVPGVIIFTRWVVAPAALITERLGPLAALGRSWRLVKGRFWPVLGAVVLAYLLYIIANQLISTVAAAVTVFGPIGSDVMSLVPTIVGSLLVSVIASPFLAAIVTTIYFDLRVRKEGYDLELMAADLNADQDIPPVVPRAAADDPFGLGNPDGR